MNREGAGSVVSRRDRGGRDLLFEPTDVADAFHTARVVVSVAIAVAAMVLAAIWAWEAGLIVAAVALAVGADATIRLRGETRTPLELLIVVDITAVGAGVLLSGLPDIVVVAPYGYMLTAAVLVLSRRRGWRVATYIALWSGVVLSLDMPMVGGSLSSLQEQLIVATGVVIYLAATFVLTSVAAAAVRERNALDQRLRTSRQRLRTVVNGAPVVLFAIDSAGVFTLSEGAGLEVLGLKPGEVVGRTIDDVYASAPKVIDLVNRTMREGREIHEVVDLGIASFDVRTTPQRDESGQVVGTMGIATDVTEAVRSRHNLEQKIIVEQLLSSLSGELFALRPEGEPEGIVDALGKAAGYAGCDRAMLVAPARGGLPQLAYSWSRTRRDEGGIVDDGLRLPWFETRLHECGYLSVGRLSDLPVDALDERRFCRTAGFTSVVAVPLGAERVEGGYLVFATTGWERIWSSDDVVLFRMVGEMLANVLARRRARTQLEALVASKDRFIASISHELRTPLASVLGLSEELRDRLDDFEREELREFHRIVAEQAGELSAIVEDLLVVARIDIDQVKVVCEPVSLTAELNFVVAPLRDEDRRHIEVVPHGDVPAWCDRKRVRQVLRNLVMNALRHGGEAIRIEARRDGAWAVVDVVDDGPGIPEAEHERIFQPYEQASSVPGKPGSIGLGLTVARSLSRLMGGDLRYERRDDLSVFRLSLPIHEDAAESGWRAAV